MSYYRGRHAELYDVFYADKPYAAEARFLSECIDRFGRENTRDVLDLACGTGRHAHELAGLGYDVVGVDISEDMIAQARRGKRNGARVEFRCADMREIGSPRASYDAAVCLFDSIGYVRTTQAVREVFSAVRAQLRPAGLFVCEFWHAPTMRRRFDAVRERRWPTSGGQVVRRSETTLDLAQNLASVTYSVHEQNGDGSSTDFVETQVNRFFTTEEMSENLAHSGFELVGFFDGFSSSTAVTDECWHVLALATRNDRD